MSDFINVAKISDVPEGEGRVFHVGRIEVAVFHVDGSFHALDNTCIHRGGPLGDGMCSGTTVTCPWHGWQFDVVSGKCLNSPGESVDRYETRIDGDDLQVKI
jgi:nitrite reductase/ring-hydroxylating ferredoxin subunit